MLDARIVNSILRVEVRIELRDINRSTNFVRLAPRASKLWPGHNYKLSQYTFQEITLSIADEPLNGF